MSKANEAFLEWQRADAAARAGQAKLRAAWDAYEVLKTQAMCRLRRYYWKSPGSAYELRKA